jgi:hypothetical protein
MVPETPICAIRPSYQYPVQGADGSSTASVVFNGVGFAFFALFAVHDAYMSHRTSDPV